MTRLRAEGAWAGGARRMSSWREAAAVLAAGALLTALFTYPIAFKPGRVGRIDNGDGQFSIWNVAWVARTLVTDPLHVFDANIFYPHRGTLAYSENNLGAGALAIPVYWANAKSVRGAQLRRPAVLSVQRAGMYCLVRLSHRRSGERRRCRRSGFAFCPYIFAQTAHIQLLMTAGVPFACSRSTGWPTGRSPDAARCSARRWPARRCAAATTRSS